jgi:hypothetical protein
MKKEQFILATDYKSSFFSAVFSFETATSPIKTLDKYDLLHAYMVGEIIRKFDKVYENGESRPFIVQNLLEQVNTVIKSIKNKSPIKKIENSSEEIKKEYPIETSQIDKIIDDDTGFVVGSFFVPMMLSDVLKELEILESKKKKNLCHIDIQGQFLNESINSFSLMFDMFFDLINRKNINDPNITEEVVSTTANLLKETIELSLVTTGEFDAYAERKNQNKQNTQTPKHDTEEEG